MSSSPADYKKLKEDFVSNLSGGTVTEIVYVTAVAPVGHLQDFFLSFSVTSFHYQYGPLSLPVYQRQSFKIA
jgi:phosphatidylinositol glycan class W